MKYLVIIFFSITTISLHAQIQGDGHIVTKTYQLDLIEQLEIGLYAKVVVDMSAPSNSITITADENLLELIDREVVDARLVLNQKKWINASQLIKISINAPNLTFVQQSTHETTYVNGINKKEFSAMANVGKIILDGKVDHLQASGEVGTVDALLLRVDQVHVNLWSWGKILLNEPNIITGKVKDGGKVIYDNDDATVKVKTSKDGRVVRLSDFEEEDFSKNKYIDIKIKNNSRKRLQAYVRGPKPDGDFFSYGFPMRPNQVRKERWTVGTKVFRKTALGKKKLVELTAQDKGQLVMLYDN